MCNDLKLKLALYWLEPPGTKQSKRATFINQLLFYDRDQALKLMVI